MPKRYRVTLTEADREWLIEFIGRGMAPAREQARARVLLKADEGPEGPEWNDDQIAEALELSVGGVANIRRRYAELIRLACSEAPEGRSQFSLDSSPT